MTASRYIGSAWFLTPEDVAIVRETPRSERAGLIRNLARRALEEATEADEPHSVYLLSDRVGRLLYVGVSKDVARRFEDHRARSEWWPEVAHRSVENYPSRSEALRREGEAIRTLAPAYNRRDSFGDEPPEVTELRKLAAESEVLPDARLCSHCQWKPAAPRRSECYACRRYRQNNGVARPDHLIRRELERAGITP